MSKETTETTPFKLADVTEPDPKKICNCSPEEIVKKFHPILYEKLEALQERYETEELDEADTLWKFVKLFAEADVDPYALGLYPYPDWLNDSSMR